MKNPSTEKRIDLSIVLGGLMHLHGRKWRGYVFKIVRNHEDAEDVVQEAVRRVLARNRTFASTDDARMYLARAIGNTAIEYYHARKRERIRQCPLSECADLQSAATNPQERLVELETCAERNKIMDLLGEGLNRLPPKQYEALRLTVLDSGTSSIREAGVGNGIPYSTLRHRSVQGLRRLRSYIRRMLREASLRFALV
jgi:RNA polymerase sigma factor (sigma-70 family)